MTDRFEIDPDPRRQDRRRRRGERTCIIIVLAFWITVSVLIQYLRTR